MIQSNTTLDAGLGRGFEAGATVLSLNFNDRTRSFFLNDTNDVDPYNPLIVFNGLKLLQLSNKVSLSFGSQFGLNFRKNRKAHQAGLAECNLAFDSLLRKENKFVIGAYYNSTHYGGRGNRLGVWLAGELRVLKKFHFMAESVLGTSTIAYTSLALIYYPRKWLPLTLGLQIPNAQKNSYSVVVELTICVE